MRINRKRLKKRRHTNSIKIPAIVKKLDADNITEGIVPSDDQIRMAIKLGVVQRTNDGKLDPQSLLEYFRSYAQQRRTDDARKSRNNLK